MILESIGQAYACNKVKLDKKRNSKEMVSLQHSCGLSGYRWDIIKRISQAISALTILSFLVRFEVQFGGMYV